MMLILLGNETTENRSRLRFLPPEGRFAKLSQASTFYENGQRIKLSKSRGLPGREGKETPLSNGAGNCFRETVNKINRKRVVESAITVNFYEALVPCGFALPSKDILTD